MDEGSFAESAECSKAAAGNPTEVGPDDVGAGFCIHVEASGQRPVDLRGTTSAIS